MHHGSAHKVERMLAKLEGIALFDDDASVGVIGAEEVDHHIERLLRGYDDRLGISLQKVVDVSAVVRLHMLYDKIIGLSVADHGLEVIEPLLAEMLIDGVHDRDLFVDDGIGIVRHTVGNDILSLKKIDIMIVDADILDIIGNKHGNHLLT